jgi:hypothetical protein
MQVIEFLHAVAVTRLILYKSASLICVWLLLAASMHGLFEPESS